MRYRATILRHRRDYQGVLSRPHATRRFNDLEAARQWADKTMNETHGTYAHIDRIHDDITIATSGTDGEWWEFYLLDGVYDETGEAI